MQHSPMGSGHSQGNVPHTSHSIDCMVSLPSSFVSPPGSRVTIGLGRRMAPLRHLLPDSGFDGLSDEDPQQVGHGPLFLVGHPANRDTHFVRQSKWDVWGKLSSSRWFWWCHVGNIHKPSTLVNRYFSGRCVFLSR